MRRLRDHKFYEKMEYGNKIEEPKRNVEQYFGFWPQMYYPER